MDYKSFILTALLLGATASAATGPYSGIMVESIEPSDLRRLGIETAVRVLSVIEKGPAAGVIEEGDLILAVDGRPVTDPRQFHELVAALKEGARIRFTLRRADVEKRVPLTLSKESLLLESSKTEARARVGTIYVTMVFPSQPSASSSGGSGAGYLGVSIQDNPRGFLKEREGFPRGALVRQVLRGSAAERASLARGDVILEVNGHSVKSATALTEIIQTFAPGDEVALLIDRQGRQLNLHARLQPRPSR